MKNRIAIALGCAAMIVGMLVTQVTMAAEPATKPASKAVVTGKKSMAEKGSFHVIHAKKGKLDCEDCHEKDGLAANTIMLRLHDKLAKGDPGRVDHNGCLVCHKDLGASPVRYAATGEPAKK